ncbi:hypothetical protein RFI_16579 [Reticulomyxa filosa]|uniref:Uncharacterized protein n=1 Tax=Reticulomyxa filosa TaxID=46433 RepID=X6N5P8_RETFI|nr:hypothetical protein RFI_16579 [Reticulomyxa filosa]|eukprot:ETO20637.1 hypothetical protein RFI_16579 [Reticulomyxa filosa]
MLFFFFVFFSFFFGCFVCLVLNFLNFPMRARFFKQILEKAIFCQRKEKQQNKNEKGKKISTNKLSSNNRPPPPRRATQITSTAAEDDKSSSPGITRAQSQNTSSQAPQPYFAQRSPSQSGSPFAQVMIPKIPKPNSTGTTNTNSSANATNNKKNNPTDQNKSTSKARVKEIQFHSKKKKKKPAGEEETEAHKLNISMTALPTNEAENIRIVYATVNSEDTYSAYLKNRNSPDHYDAKQESDTKLQESEPGQSLDSTISRSHRKDQLLHQLHELEAQQHHKEAALTEICRQDVLYLLENSNSIDLLAAFQSFVRETQDLESLSIVQKALQKTVVIFKLSVKIVLYIDTIEIFVDLIANLKCEPNKFMHCFS